MKLHILRSAVLLLAFTTASAQKPGINLSHIDSSANPRQDFYTFCNGKWQKKFKLPESDSRYGSFNEIHEGNLKKIKVIYDNLSKSKTPAAKGSNEQKLRDFYTTAMDSVKANKLGIRPIQPLLAEVDALRSPDDLMNMKVKWELIGIDLFFGTGVSPDLKNSRRNVFGINQSGYGLGDRDYYHSEKQENIRTEYVKYLAQLFQAAGTSKDSAKLSAEKVLAFEKKLTEKALTRVEMRDPEKLYNVVRRMEMMSVTPGVNWERYFRAKGISPDTVIIGMVDYMHNLSEVIMSTPLPELKMYAKARLLTESAPYLSSNLAEINFNFRGKVMSGAKQMKPRWQRVHNVVNGAMGEIISQEFVKKHFPPEAKQKLNKLIDNLIASYRERIATRDWMSAETKTQANRKLDLLIRKIGYPDKWKDYTALKVGTNSYWENVCEANTFLTLENLEELKKPVDRMKWQMTPITVNAYYDPTTNEITFPAAILQPPFYDASADDAANYGTMGSIIGHELTHGFDDQGARFDADGNMKMWWTEKDFQNFKDRTRQIVQQFNDYVAIDSMHVNGDMTQGENIADLGGLTMSYYAYKKSLGGKASPVIAGFTGEQRFFIAWAQGWKTITRDAELKRLLTIDYHSPGYFRAFAPLTNMPEFREAFGVKPGDKMYTPDEKRVEIW